MSNHFEFKVVVAGPFAAGKTTMIRTISDDEIVGTEAPTSGPESEVKATTTVGMEFGTLNASGEGFSAGLNLYGVPGQERFRFMWDIVGTGIDGLFLLVDASRPETWPESLQVGTYFQMARTAPVVVGVNRASDDPELFERACDAVPLDDAVYVNFDVTDAAQVRGALAELLMLVLDELPDSYLDSRSDGAAEQESVSTSADRGCDVQVKAPQGAGGSR